MHQRGSSNGRRSPNCSTSVTTLAPAATDVVACRRFRIAGDHDDGQPGLRRQFDDPTDHLALETLPVEEPLAGDDDVGRTDPFVQVDMVGDEVEPGDQPSADREQPAGQPAGGARAVDLSDVDAEASDVVLGDPVEPGREQVHLGRRGALLRREHSGGVDEAGPHVARHLELDRAHSSRPADRLDRTEPAVGRGRAAEPDDDGACALLDRPSDEFAGTRCRGVHRVVAVQPAGELESAGERHLDHRGSVLEPPRCFDRHAERTRHAARPVRPAEHLQDSFAAVGHRALVDVEAELPARRADRRGRVTRRDRAPELVERGEDSHPPDRNQPARRARGRQFPTRPVGFHVMAVTVRIPTTMRPLAGGASTIQVEAGSLSDVIKALDHAHAGFAERLLDEGALRKFVNVFVDDDDVRYLNGLDTEVADGVTVSIIPAVAGG